MAKAITGALYGCLTTVAILLMVCLVSFIVQRYGSEPVILFTFICGGGIIGAILNA